MRGVTRKANPKTQVHAESIVDFVFAVERAIERSEIFSESFFIVRLLGLLISSFLNFISLFIKHKKLYGFS